MADAKNPQADPIFFANRAAFRKWLKKNHASCREQWIGFYRKASGRPSITWPESVDEALCVGWIDGLRKTIDAQSYKIRFTPRKKESNWSAVNIGRVKELTKEGRMQPTGLAAFALRKEAKSGIYAYENRKTAVMDKADEKRFRSNPKAWEFFQRQPAAYRQNVIWYLVMAKQEATRERRLEKVIAESEAGRRL
ncbi:MAG TPA: YdeI/OmpD-associated family protein [Chthoniobacterales bacterium]|nr:YdeI/OmpD-associated family protein [Chthoniobacterales bacterium]